MQSGFTFRRLSRVRLGFIGSILLAALLVGGCGKPEQPSTASPVQPPSSQVVLATHWIGKARMAQDTNAAYQMEIWNMPESVRLEEQTLDKLARALPTLLGVPSGGDTNGLVGVIRPLLNDLVQAESFVEVRAITNQPAEFALAIRLSSERWALWQTNVAVVKEAMAGPKTNSASSLKSVRLSVAGEWTVLGFGADDGPLFTDFVERFSAAKPRSTSNENYFWLELDADLGRLVRSKSILPSGNLPLVHLTLAGEGQTVRTRGEMNFPKPLETRLEPWNVPTNLIHDPLVSFTAIRRTKSWIESSSVWRDLQAGDAPNQLYSWALGQIPSQSYFAAVWPDSSNRFRILSERIVQGLNSYVVPNGLGKPSRMTNANGIAWMENPFSQPFLRHETGPVAEIVFGGFSPLSLSGQPIPPGLLSQFANQTNVLYYDWEITEGRVMGWLYLGQFMRFVSGKPQLTTGSAGLAWLQGVGPKLGNTATIVHQVAPARLTISRTSSAGFTGIELQGLMDWFESPEFPIGLHTFLAPAPVTRHRTRTNASPVQPGVP